MEIVQSIGYIKYMDLLSQRYASPFFVVDEFIQLGQFYDFNVEIIKTIIEEKKEQFRWEYFLHKVFDKSYEDFVESCEEEPIQEMTNEEVKDVIGVTESLLDLF